METIYNTYKVTIDENLKRIQLLKRKIHILGTIRLLIVIAAMITMGIMGVAQWIYWPLVTVIYAIPFVFFMVWHNRLAYRRSYAEEMMQLCEGELKALDYDFSAFDGAPDKADAVHSFSFDLDLFGERSFFQSINRTVTHGGREKLSGWFINPLTNKATILQRQKAIEELSSLTTIRQHFYVTGQLNPGNKDDIKQLPALLGTSVGLKYPLLWKTLIWVIPILWVILITGYAFGLVDIAIPVIFFFFSMFIANAKRKQINRLHKSIDKIEKIISVYSRLMKIVENQPFESPMLKDIQKHLLANNLTASQAIGLLSRHLGTFDQRDNKVIMLLNIFILRDFRILFNLENWKKANACYINQWIDALTEFDALASLAGFAYNHPGYSYPEIADNYFIFSGKGLGHPLIHRDICVRNDISIKKHPSFMIITGANMAGKSTYLRTVGLNFVLACIGSPVCANSLTVYPANLVTSLRTSDSLIENESYFFAELKRLKMIIDRLQSGEELFIILDEILKGTNSIDKQKGSLALVRQFITYDTCGIIATHDLVLGTLEQEFPDLIKNYRFEADITDDKLTFTYTLREGIAQNMNAYFLMQKMGITMD